MNRIFPLLIALVCLTPGCFDTHGGGDDSDDPPRWTDCWSALTSGGAGDSCAFVDACGDVGCEDAPSRTVSCILGEVRFIERICSPVVWFDCEEFRASGWGTTSDVCDPSTFGACGGPLIDCCASSYHCEEGAIVESFVCADGCEGPPPFCEDYTPPPPERSGCRESSDCGSGESCVVPGDTLDCEATCFEPFYECMTSADCAEGNVCVEVPEACPCAGPSYLCQPACTTDSCDEGSVCTDGGTCEAVPCGDEYMCPSNMRCAEPFGPHEIDEHGCVRLACASDADCDCGACIEAWCRSGPGVCSAPPPPG